MTGDETMDDVRRGTLSNTGRALERVTDALRAAPSPCEVEALRAELAEVKDALARERQRNHDACATERRLAQELAVDVDLLRDMIREHLERRPSAAENHALAVRFSAFEVDWRARGGR